MASVTIATAWQALAGWTGSERDDDLRALGPIERSLLQYHDELAGSGNTARIVEFEGPLTLDLLHAALRALQCRHPFLRVGIERAPAPVFVDRPTAIVPVATATRTAPDDWIALVEQSLAERFVVGDGPFLRVLWLDGRPVALPDMLVLVTCHVVSDGFSSSTMVAELFEILATLADDGTPDRTPRPCPPSTSELLPAETAGVGGALQVAQLLLRQILNTASAAHLPARSARLGTRRTRILPHALPPGTTERLAAAAKQHGATIHGALLAAKLIAAATLITAGRSPSEPVALTAVSTTNLRPRLHHPDLDTELAARVGGLRSASVVRATSPFWPLARQLAQDIRAGLARNDDMLAAPLAPAFSYLQAFVPDLAPAAVQLANLGRTPVRERYGAFRVRSVQAALNVCGFGPSLLSHVTTTATGTYWNFLYSEPLFTRADVTAYAGTTIDLVRRMAASAA